MTILFEQKHRLKNLINEVRNADSLVARYNNGFTNMSFEQVQKIVDRASQRLEDFINSITNVP